MLSVVVVFVEELGLTLCFCCTMLRIREYGEMAAAAGIDFCFEDKVRSAIVVVVVAGTKEDAWRAKREMSNSRVIRMALGRVMTMSKSKETGMSGMNE